MGFFGTRSNKNSKNTALSKNLAESGNVFMMLFGAVGMVGVLGASTMTVMKGPVKTMSQVTKRTVAENNMIAGTKMAAMVGLSQNPNSCDDDDNFEPIPYTTALGTGGKIPNSIGATKLDSWGKDFMYCAWNHGGGTGCSGSGFLDGSAVEAEIAQLPVIALISGGPDGNIGTTCEDFVSTTVPLIDRSAGSASDDLVLALSYGEVGTIAGGVWNIKSGDSETAEIQKNLEVVDASDNVIFGVDSSSDPSKPSIKVDYISEMTSGGAGIEFLSPVTTAESITTTAGANISTTGTGNISSAGTLSATGNVSGADLVASGALTGATLGTTGAALIGTTLDVTSNLTLLNSQLNVPLAGSGLAVTDGAGVSMAIKVGGIHIGGPYGGSVPVDGEIVTAGPTNNIMLKPNGVTALTLNAATQAATFADAVNVTGTTTLAGNLLANAGVTVDGKNVIEPINGRVHRAHWNDDTRYGFFTGHNNSGARGYYLGYGNGTTSVDLHLDSASELLLSGGTLNMSTNKITSLGVPTADADATTKKYVDDNIAAGTGYTETDPTITKPMGTNKWCYSDGTKLICDKNDPTVAGFGDNLGNGGTTTGGIYSKSAAGYGYFGSSANNYFRFDDAPAASANRIYTRLGANWEYVFHNNYFGPYANNVNDLGSAAQRWKNGYFSGRLSLTGVAGAAPTK